MLKVGNVLHGKIQGFDPDGNATTDISRNALEATGGKFFDVTIEDLSVPDVRRVPSYREDDLAQLSLGECFTALNSQGGVDFGIYGRRLDQLHPRLNPIGFKPWIGASVIMKPSNPENRFVLNAIPQEQEPAVFQGEQQFLDRLHRETVNPEARLQRLGVLLPNEVIVKSRNFHVQIWDRRRLYVVLGAVGNSAFSLVYDPQESKKNIHFYELDGKKIRTREAHFFHFSGNQTLVFEGQKINAGETELFSYIKSGKELLRTIQSGQIPSVAIRVQNQLVPATIQSDESGTINVKGILKRREGEFTATVAFRQEKGGITEQYFTTMPIYNTTFVDGNWIIRHEPDGSVLGKRCYCRKGVWE